MSKQQNNGLTPAANFTEKRESNIHTVHPVHSGMKSYMYILQTWTIQGWGGILSSTVQLRYIQTKIYT